MVNDSVKERVVDKRQIREMRHQAGVRYLDFTPAMMYRSSAWVRRWWPSVIRSEQ